MKVRELKEELNKYRDDAEVCVETGDLLRGTKSVTKVHPTINAVFINAGMTEEANKIYDQVYEFTGHEMDHKVESTDISECQFCAYKFDKYNESLMNA